MEKVKFLTQDNCPKCVSLKQFLELGLRDKYVEHIEYIKKEENEKEFFALVRKYKLMSTPILIYGDDVLLNPTPTTVSAFLEKYFN